MRRMIPVTSPATASTAHAVTPAHRLIVLTISGSYRRTARYRGGGMAGKKDYDATKNLPEGEPTQTLPKGTKTGLPKGRSVFAALDKIVKKPS